MKALAIIPARGGSKRIPRKNLRPFLGRPILAYSIEAALASGCFEEVMVSTDDPEIADTARRFGAEVPFLRSAASSDDFATTAQVLTEVLDRYRNERRAAPEFLCCLYPTAPFVSADLIRRGARLLADDPGTDGALTAVRYGHPIQRAFGLEEGRLAYFWPENRDRRSQDLPPAYHDAGQLYWMRASSFLRSGTVLGEKCVPLLVEETEVQDIDSETDWVLAELKYRRLHPHA